MLEQRLLQNAKVSYETEVRNVELMKKRFGDNCMYGCDAMLRDVQDSVRINREVQQLKV